jgi:hypothetical protein
MRNELEDHWKPIQFSVHVLNKLLTSRRTAARTSNIPRSRS